MKWVQKILFVSLFLSFLIAPLKAYAAIATDSANALEGNTTVDVTVGSLSSRVAIGYVWVGSGSCVPTATLGGVSMTFIESAFSGAHGAHAFKLLNPSSGSQTFAISGCSANGVAIATYSGVSDVDTSTSASFTSGNSFSHSITTVTDNDWVSTSFRMFAGGTTVVSTNVTMRAAQFDVSVGDNNGVVHPAGSFSQTWVNNDTPATGTNPGMMLQVSLTPAATVTNVAPIGLVKASWWY